MKMDWIFLLLFLITPSSYANLSTEVRYGKAINAAQHGDWKNTQEHLSNLIVDMPERPELLYDNGVAAYRLSEFEKAAAYFSSVAESDTASLDLKKQAFFNLGNANVSLKNYQEALPAYERVLKIDPNNEPARHNLEKVRQLMQQENKQQQDQKNDQKNDSNDKNEQDKQQDNEQSSGENGQNQSDKKDQQGKEDGSRDKHDEQNGQSDNSSESDESAGEEKNKERAKEQNNRDEKGKPDKKSGKQDGANKKNDLRDDHDSSPVTKNTDSQATKNDDQSQEIQAGAIDDGEKSRKQEEHEELLGQLGADKKWMAHILDRQEKADEKAQKKLVKATVDKALAGDYGQNCW